MFEIKAKKVFLIVGIFIVLLLSIMAIAKYSGFGSSDRNITGNVFLGSGEGNAKKSNEGIGGESLEFDGNSYILQQKNSQNSPQEKITLTGWFKTRNLLSADREITGSWISKRGSFMLFPFTDGSVAFFLFLDGQWIEARSPPKLIKLNEWEKWTGAYDNERIYLYRNDVLVASTKAEGKIGTGGDICIGHDCFDEPNSRYFNGYIDEIQIESFAMSDRDIKSQYLEQMLRLIEPKKLDSEINTFSTTEASTGEKVMKNALLYFDFESGAKDDFGNSISLKNGASLIDSGDGKALKLTNNAYAEIQAPLSSLDEFTLYAWIKTNTVDKEAQAIVEKGSEGIKGWQVYLTEDKIYYFSGQADYPVSSGSGAIEENKWQHIAVVWNGDIVRIFVNSKEVAAGAVTAPDNRAPTLLVGARYFRATPSNGFEGLIGELSIIPEAAHRDDVKAKYDSQKSYF